MYRHGDVQIQKVDALPEDCEKVKGLVLAEGEATGHAHRVDLGELFKTKDGKLYLRVEKLARVSHEEHKTITLAPGVYRIGQKRQYAPDTERGYERVAD